MIPKCDCPGCQHIAKRLKKPIRPEIPPEFENLRCNQNCIPKQNEEKNFARDINTSDIYRTVNIPDRFERSCTLNGYGIQYKIFTPMYRTTSSEYGWMPPNAHTVPHRYYPLANEFTELLAKTGMYRNYSLNTVMDKTRV